MNKIIINHVMSSDQQSSIFSDILAYFKDCADDKFIHIHSMEPIDNAHVYHYHRPHLEHSLKTPAVVTVHHDLNDTGPSVLFEKFEKIYREAGTIICLNTLQKQYLEQRGFKNLIVIPHGYNPLIFAQPQKKIVKSQYSVLISSKRYGRRVKGEAYFIDLLRWLDNELVKFILVGENRYLDAGYLEKFGFEYLLYERLPYRSYKNLYDACDFLLMCSFFEGGPANLPEAVASATPVLCNPVGMANDLIINNYNGLWLSMDPWHDATVLNNNLRNASYVTRLFENAYCESLGKRVLTWEESCLRNCAVYEEICR